LVAAASSAAATLPDPRRAESELLKQLRKHEAGAEHHKKGEASSIGYVNTQTDMDTDTHTHTHTQIIVMLCYPF